MAAPLKVQRVLEAIDPDVKEMRTIKSRIEEIEAERVLRVSPLEGAMKPLQEQLDEINSETDALLQPLNEAYGRLEKSVGTRIRRNQDRLVEWFKKKTIPFLSGGRAKISKNPPRLEMLVDEQEIVQALRDAGFDDLVEEKPVVLVEALKRNDEALEALGDMVSVAQDTKVKIELE
jgi:phage host-nuclease inhibitor protein Gam